MKALAVGRYREARETLHQIATEEPQEKRYRVQLHYAWGLEHQSQGRSDLAVRELERALTLDPTCREAKDALAALRRPSRT